MSSARQNITAIIYDKRGRVLSRGRNNYIKTHPLQAKYAAEAGMSYKQYLHAEIDALIKCRGQPHKIKITRVSPSGRLGLAKPCPICELAIKESKIKYIEYSI